MIKRWRARARGRAAQIRKRTCHITLTLVPARDGYSDASALRPPAAEGEAEARAAPQGRAEGEGRDQAQGRGEKHDGRRRSRRRRPKPKAKAATPKPKTPDQEEGGERRLMGQKVHPGGMRVGVIHDWKSNWFSGTKEFPEALLEDIKIREHIYNKLAHAGLSDVLIRKDKQRITIDIYTARPGIVIGKSGAEVDALRKEIHAHDAQERPHQHQRDQAPRARREARRAVDRGAAPEPRQLPARDEALARLGDALGRPRREGAVRRPARRHRDEPLGELLRGPRAAAHDPRRHRLRLRRGEDDLRPHRRQGLDQQGRDHARGLRERRPAEGDAARRPGHGAPPRRPHRGPVGFTRERARPAQDREGLGPVRARAPAARRAGRRGPRQEQPAAEAPTARPDARLATA